MHRMLKRTILSLALSVGTLPALAQTPQPPPPLSSRIASYAIDVRLDPAAKMLTGKETLTWKNTSQDTVRDIPLHLYLNAFRNTRSTYMRERIARGSSIGQRTDGWGFVEIRSVSLPSGESITRNGRFIHPDDANTEDRTVILYTLPTPVPPGASLKLLIEFTAQLPSPPIARSGAKEDFFFVGQWFPKAGVYIDGRWNCHQYHANSEFFADFGLYDVSITLPADYILGATGREQEVRTHPDGTATHRYRAEDVHDFAWTASPSFVEATGRTQDVEIRVLLQPEHASQASRHLAAARTAVEHFQEWYGDYPYPTLTVVDPRRGADAVGGMEYPTLITAGSTVYGLPEGVRLPELIITHEFGHNYWYGLVASNEFEESWLDEGINTYTEFQVMSHAYGPEGDALSLPGISLTDLAFGRAQYILMPKVDPVVRRAWEFYDGGSYGVNSYMRPGLILTTLHNYLGGDMMRRIIRTYSDRWRFRHPKTKDFIGVASEVAGRDLSWYFDQVLNTNGVLDYGVEAIHTTEILPPRGIDYTRTAVRPDSDMAAAPAGGDSLRMYWNEVAVRRIGQVRFPVELLVVFENGERVREFWDGQDLWKKWSYVRNSRVAYATVDPDRKIPLDVSYTNNSRTTESQKTGSLSAALRLLLGFQLSLDYPDLPVLLRAAMSMF